MIKKLYEPFVDWATRLKNKYTNDPFFRAQVRLIILFFLVGSIISVVVSDLADYFLRESLYTITSLNSGDTIKLAFNHAERSLWFWRAVKLILTVIAAYFLVTFTFRPVKKSAELQRRFAAVASHELRTPLAIIKNTVEVALRNKSTLTLEKAVRILESNKEEVERLANITEFLMVYSKLKEIRGPFPLKPTELVPVVEKTVAFIEKYSNQPRKIGLKTSGSGLIKADPTSLKLLLVNLLKNAVEHTPADGKINIEITEDNSCVFVTISDTGSGIAKEDIPYIFEPFYSGAAAEFNPEKGGVGLGLSIVKEIAKLHKASVVLESTSERGTVFKITFDKA